MSAEGALDVDIQVRERGALDRVDVAFHAAPGFTVLFGPSGAGKTTTLMAIAGLVTPRAGSIKLGGTDLTNVPAHRRRISLVFQSLALFPHLTATENVAYGVRAPRAQRRDQALAWLRRLRVEHVATRRPDTLSGGEGQRVALARALATDPQALLLDEPFSALDDALRVSVREDLRTIVDERKLPVVFVTHDRGEAQALAQHVVLMSEGRVTAAGGVDLLT
ncbi:MAG: ABC transporter ATP-binding protein [Deltaproteobacteria bacterium]|nr:ABC transporter ATP-binding protein [Deltaproteobacteria bacterium]